MTLDIAAVGEVDQLARNSVRAFDEMRASPPLPGHGPARLPGEGKRAMLAQRRAEGVVLYAALRRDLQDLAEEYALCEQFEALYS
jgi:LDH2 family malate/lactate/ureidoglycolate dehydrogenase